MDKKKLEKEQYCVEVKYLCDLLKTKMFMIDDFKNYEKYSKKLEEIKAQADDIYWNL